MKKETWYHATTYENGKKILEGNQFIIGKVINGNFLGRGIYFGNTIDIVRKYGEIIFQCEITMNHVFYSEQGNEIVAARDHLRTLSNKRTGDLLKDYYRKKNYSGVNFPADRISSTNRKLVIYDTDLITINNVIDNNDCEFINEEEDINE